MSSLPENGFSPEERQALLELARSAILSALIGSPAKTAGAELPAFSMHLGVFVTVHVAGDLRGCIGVIEGRDPLRQSVPHCAESAAFRDPRFPPLEPAEIRDLQIEISVLSELSPISPEKIEIGKHGLLIELGERRGLLLPQVAVEYHLSRERFLEETCRKAGLPGDAWRRSETQLYGFTCEVFQEGPASDGKE